MSIWESDDCVARASSFDAAAPGPYAARRQEQHGWKQRMRMHDDEVDISAGLVRRFVADQFPLLRNQPVTEFESTGTVNAIYRLGSDGRLHAVPDFGATGLGDPATDLNPA